MQVTPFPCTPSLKLEKKKTDPQKELIMYRNRVLGHVGYDTVVTNDLQIQSVYSRAVPQSTFLSVQPGTK